MTLFLALYVGGLLATFPHLYWRFPRGIAVNPWSFRKDVFLAFAWPVSLPVYGAILIGHFRKGRGA